MEESGRHAATLVRPLVPLLSGAVFCGLVALLADRASWIEAMANSFLPYVAIPLACGLLLPRRPSLWLAGAGLYGAGSSLAAVLAFYDGNALVSPYALSTWGVFFWSGAAVVTGALLAVFSWWVQPYAFRRPRVWGAACCVLLLAAQLAVVAGPSRFSPADLAGLLLVVLLACSLNLWRFTRDPASSAGLQALGGRGETREIRVGR